VIELYRGRFGSHAAASLAATTARSLGYLVEVRGAGGAGWIVVVEALRSPGGAPCAMPS
jgi:hypothetical protein